MLLRASVSRYLVQLYKALKTDKTPSQSVVELIGDLCSNKNTAFSAKVRAVLVISRVISVFCGFCPYFSH